MCASAGEMASDGAFTDAQQGGDRRRVEVAPIGEDHDCPLSNAEPFDGFEYLGARFASVGHLARSVHCLLTHAATRRGAPCGARFIENRPVEIRPAVRCRTPTSRAETVENRARYDIRSVARPDEHGREASQLVGMFLIELGVR